MGVLRTLSGNSNQELTTDEMDANRTEPRRVRRAIPLGLEVADGERSTDDQSGFSFCFLALLTKDLPEAGLKGWQLLAMPAKDFPRTG
jgi:hypothetical protein